MSIVCCFSRHISREICQKWSSWDTSGTTCGSLTCYATILAPEILAAQMHTGNRPLNSPCVCVVRDRKRPESKPLVFKF